MRVQWALLHVFLRVGEAQAHPDRRPKPKPSQARPSQEEGSGWQVKRLKTPHLTCFYVSERPGPSPRPKTKPNPSQARPSQTRPGRRVLFIGLHLFLRVGEAHADDSYVFSHAGWAPGTPRTPSNTCFRVSGTPRPKPRPKPKPSPGQARPGQARQQSGRAKPRQAKPKGQGPGRESSIGL